MRIDFEELHLTKQEKNDIRDRAIRKRRAKTLIKDLFFNAFFLFFLFVVAYTNKDINSFGFKNTLENIFIDSNFGQANKLKFLV